jgi:hypothetical protein
MSEKSEMGNLLGEDVYNFPLYENDDYIKENDASTVYSESDEDHVEQYAQSVVPLNYQEMPANVCDSKLKLNQYIFKVLLIRRLFNCSIKFWMPHAKTTKKTS